LSSTLIGLQRSAGNAAVSRLIQRQDATSGVQNRPNLLGGTGPQLHLDPQIEAEIRRIELNASSTSCFTRRNFGSR
jgi:hypothetical protein